MKGQTMSGKARKDLKGQERTRKGKKWPETARNGQKRPETAINGQKRANNGSETGQKRLLLALNHTPLSDINFESLHFLYFRTDLSETFIVRKRFEICRGKLWYPKLVYSIHHSPLWCR